MSDRHGDSGSSLEAALRFARASGAWIVEGPPRSPRRAGPAADGPAAGAGALAAVRDELGDCHRCRLGQGRTHLVFGTGSPGARLMFVGEAPGEEEDRRGEPFVGRAGRLLDQMIRALGLTRDEVYIANVLKCRPPGNRDLLPDEAATCLPFLWAQVEAVGPRVVCALGAHAARSLLGAPAASLGNLRGPVRQVGGRAVVATFHPAYLLRKPLEKRQAWHDLKRVRALL
ncbi:MAG: uracil-DNA glycosylase [Deferrisomatales bacterium]